MNDLQTRWLAALRDGSYKQGKSHFRNENNAYCCLGVVCDLSGFGEWEAGTYVIRVRDSEELGNNYTLPKTIRDVVGLSSAQQRELAYRNDGLDIFPRHTFPEIADVIERMFTENEENA